MLMHSRSRRLLLLGAAACLLIPACSSDPREGEIVAECVSWSDLADPQTAFNVADAVIIGRPVASSGAKLMFSVDATVHEVDVVQIFKGEIDETVSIASTPETCTTGSPYPNGDPLETELEVLLFLTAPADDGIWSTVTPVDGVRSVPEDGSLPFDSVSPSDQ